MRSHVILAVFKRNVLSYFSGMLGYLFIVVFVVAGAFLAFNQNFFADNLANLDQLSLQFPLLLLFIIPAITMTAWADERKLGTDELLFTLPASDFEILLGKYLGVLFVYTVALAFSITHAFVLSALGSPDWGLKPRLQPMAVPLRMPVTELLPPRWQETTRRSGPITGLVPPAT